MTVTMEALQHLLGEMHKMQSDSLAGLMKQQNDALAVLFGSGRGNSGLTDTRGIGRPVAFKGDELEYAEWKAMLMAFLHISTPQLIKWVARADLTVTEEDVDISYPNNKQDVWRFAHNLYSILLSCTEDDAFRICHSVKEGNGLEAMRLLMKRFEPRTPGTKRALLKAIISNPASNKQVEEYMKHYEVVAGADLPEDLKVTVIIDLCTKDLKEHLELSTREMTYKQVRDEIISYAERKRNAFSNDLKPMDLDEVKDDHVWWGGMEHDHEQWDQHCPEEQLYSIGWNKGVGKGDNSKGGSKGDGQGIGGKGSGFNGNCHWCGEWGHSQSRCRQKDDYRLRAENQLENLEKSGGYRCLCSLEHRGSRCVTSNRFAALPELNEDEEMPVGTGTPPGLTVGDFITVKPKHQKKTKDRKVNQHACFGDLNNVEVNTVHEKSDPNELTITIDSGASENVISEEFALQVKVRASQGSREGVRYVTANGGTMSNRGDKHIHVLTTEGHKCVLNMQVTDVKKPLMSVARICDAGHEVVFQSGGGYIKHTGSGQITKFNRVDNVYRLKVSVAQPGFSGQGPQ